MPPLPIARITHPVALCSPDAAPADLITQLLQADSSVGVMLDRQQRPIGVVRLHRLLACQLLASAGPTPVAPTDQSLANRAAVPWIEPIDLLSVSLTLPELCAHLASREGGHWAIVAEDGQFLGLLDSELALSWLASQWESYKPGSGVQSPPVPAASGPSEPVGPRRWALTQPGERGMGAGLGRAEPLSRKPSLPLETRTLSLPTLTTLSTLPLGWQWLDQVPLPLQLQTDTGRVWGQNRVWSEIFGDRPPDIPSAPPTEIGAAPSLLRQAYAYVCPLDSGEEQVWQFLSLPLLPQGDESNLAWKGEQYPGTDPTAAAENPARLLVAIEVTPLYTQNQILLAENGELWLQAQAKDEFLLSLCHDVKTPVTAILGLASLMQTAAVGPLNPRQQQYIQLIHHNARVLATLANQSFELASLDLGQLQLNLKPVDLVAVCERAIAQAQAFYADFIAGTSGSLQTATAVEPRVVQQDWQIDRRSEPVLADELRLCQMLAHLLSNALKFSAATDEVGVRVSRWHPDWLALTVWDTGMGIPDAEQSQLFQKAQRLAFAHSPYPGGVGLGLALTYRLARLHGGVISFLSQPGVGSEFTLLLPATPSSPLTPSPRSGFGGGVSSTIASQGTIVLVTEPPCQRQTLITPLQSLGYRVVVARFPQDLLEKAKCLQPSVIFLDESWLADTGTGILTVLRTDPATAHLAIIATVPDSAPTSLLQAQVDGILSLPAQLSLLQSWLERLVVMRRDVPETASAPQSLTLLALNPLLPDPLVVSRSDPTDADALPPNWASVLYSSRHRLLEADDLEQAALLATVWQPDLLLLRGDTLADPIAYLAQIQAYPELAQRAIVTLNFSPPATLVQTLNLRVFPYQLKTAADASPFLSYLQQVATDLLIP